MDLNQGEVYLITNRNNKKKYVGQTISYHPSGRKAGTITRFKTHLRKALSNDSGCPALYGSIRKYGKDNFTVETLVICNREMLDHYERNFIVLYGTMYPLGYNIESGGKLCKTLDISTREKLSLRKRFIGMSEENIRRVLESMNELSIIALPMGIWFSCDTKTGYEGFAVRCNGINRSFTAKGRTLSEKLEQAVAYLNLSKTGSEEAKVEFDEHINNQISVLIKKAKMKAMNKRALQAIINVGVGELPLYIRYEARNNRFYVKLPNEGCRYFEKNDPEKSLTQSINYIKSIAETGIGLRRVTTPMKA